MSAPNYDKQLEVIEGKITKANDRLKALIAEREKIETAKDKYETKELREVMKANNITPSQAAKILKNAKKEPAKS